jgi:hypothetical protein
MFRQLSVFCYCCCAWNPVQEDDDEPVWRQVLQHILKRVDPATWNDPELAQQAAAALEHNKPEDPPFYF